MSNSVGRFVWYELMTTDVAAAQAFYTKVVGWTITPMEMPGMSYPMWTRAGVPIGGCMALPEEARKMGAPPHWMMYVGVDSVDASYAQALRLGAHSYVAPQDIPETGRFAVLADPQGAVFALFTPHPSSAGGPSGPPLVGDFSWHELAATDYRAATEFYKALFNWDVVRDNDMGPMGIYRVFGHGSEQWGGMYSKPAEMPGPSFWLQYVKVPDINKAVEAVKANGGQVMLGPHQVPGGEWIAQCADPQGACFALHQA